MVSSTQCLTLCQNWNNGSGCKPDVWRFESSQRLFTTMITGPAIFLLLMTLLSVGLQVANHWYLSKGKLELSYPLTILVYICCTVLETYLAFRDPSQWSIILFVPMYIWAIVMAVKGIVRLRRERQHAGWKEAHAELQKQLKRGASAAVKHQPKK